MEFPTRPVSPVSPAAAYIGGKKRLADLIGRRIENIPHTTYAECFVGMGGVFFRRLRAPACEVINDISRDVTTLFRILQRHYPQFMDALKYQISSRAEFERLIQTDPATLTDLERSARFLYLQRLTFGGKVAGRSFGVSVGTPGRFDVTKLGSILEAIHERLSGVMIECLPWHEFIDRYDAPETLFYLDPPYWNGENDYGAGVFRRSDFARLAERLGSIKGRFVMSLNDVADVRRTFADFEIESVDTKYSISGETQSAAEVLIYGPGRDVFELAARTGGLFG